MQTVCRDSFHPYAGAFPCEWLVIGVGCFEIIDEGLACMISAHCFMKQGSTKGQDFSVEMWLEWAVVGSRFRCFSENYPGSTLTDTIPRALACLFATMFGVPHIAHGVSASTVS
jgi:hypothetical protein